jgi:hypothetical protein
MHVMAMRAERRNERASTHRVPATVPVHEVSDAHEAVFTSAGKLGPAGRCVSR